MLRFLEKMRMVDSRSALPGRSNIMSITGIHAVNGNSMLPPFADTLEQAMFGLGCFWGAERKFWQQPGVFATAVGYSAGYTPNPTYEEVCSGSTGHNEVVLVAYNPNDVSFDDLLKIFWESHNPTQGMQQGNDIGTQYRSGIYVFSDEQKNKADSSLERYQLSLNKNGVGEITTEINKQVIFTMLKNTINNIFTKTPTGTAAWVGAE